jgi:phosphatidate cytidylyltransferase
MQRKDSSPPPADSHSPPTQPPSDGLTAQQPAPPAAASGGGGSSEVLTRAVSCLFMAYVFLGIVSLGAEAVMPVVLGIKVMMYNEVLRISAKERKDNEMPFFRWQQWYFLAIMTFFSVSSAVREPLERTFPAVRPVFEHYVMICFAAGVVGLLAFVMSLKRGMYRYQFQQFTWMCMTLIFIVGQGTLQLQNMRRGMFWFLLPVSCVVHNDVWAYYCGKLFGRTPLLRLSPKKTWEGFIGSWLFTMAWAFWFAGFMSELPAMYCSKEDFHTPLLCRRDPIFERTVALPLGPLADLLAPVTRVIFSSTTRSAVLVSPVQLHALVFGAFASLIAPFGGFFASGLKRAFKLKDFGDLIPGHGGMTDRMDCQIVMGSFTFMYLNFVVFPPTWGAAGAAAAAAAAASTSCANTVAGLTQCLAALSAPDRARVLAQFVGGQ